MTDVDVEVRIERPRAEDAIAVCAQQAAGQPAGWWTPVCTSPSALTASAPAAMRRCASGVTTAKRPAPRRTVR